MSASRESAARWRMGDSFPLTPALSRREREERTPPFANSNAKALQALADFLPLPEGEGRGEGKGRAPQIRPGSSSRLSSDRAQIDLSLRHA
jgi:hypothetical protein